MNGLNWLQDTINRLASDPMFKLDRGDVDISKAKKDAHPRINHIAQIQGGGVWAVFFLCDRARLC
jgi:hypothetical protein